MNAEKIANRISFQPNRPRLPRCIRTDIKRDLSTYKFRWTLFSVNDRTKFKKSPFETAPGVKLSERRTLKLYDAENFIKIARGRFACKRDLRLIEGAHPDQGHLLAKVIIESVSRVVRRTLREYSEHGRLVLSAGRCFQRRVTTAPRGRLFVSFPDAIIIKAGPDGNRRRSSRNPTNFAARYAVFPR